MSGFPKEYSVDEMLSGLGRIGPVALVKPAEERAHRRIIVHGIVHLIVSRLKASILSRKRGRGDPSAVADYYEASYSSPAAADVTRYAGPERPLLFRLGKHAIASIEPRIVMSFMTQRLAAIIAACEPQSICEIGCGTGRNLFHIADRLPSTPCFGVDVAGKAIETARGIQKLNLPSTAYGHLYGLSERGADNIGKIQFQQGSAFALPFPDKSFDLVFTSAALEQMHDDASQAISEIRRISQRYVLLMEPFADSNDFWGRTYLWMQNYFRMRTDQLSDHGLETLATWTSVPVKPTFAYSFALCKVSG